MFGFVAVNGGLRSSAAEVAGATLDVCRTGARVRVSHGTAVVMAANRKPVEVTQKSKVASPASANSTGSRTWAAQKMPLYFMFVMAGLEIVKRIVSMPGALPHEKVLLASLLFALPGASAFSATKMDESLELDEAQNRARVSATEIEAQQTRSALCAAASIAGFFSAAWISPALGAVMVTGAQLYFYARTTLGVRNHVITRVDPTDQNDMKRTSLLGSLAAALSNVSPLAVAFSVLFLVMSVFNGAVMAHTRVML